MGVVTAAGLGVFVVVVATAEAGLMGGDFLKYKKAYFKKRIVFDIVSVYALRKHN